MFRKYNKYLIFILIGFFVFTQSPIIENMEDNILTDIATLKKEIDSKIKNFDEIIRQCNIDGSCDTKKTKLEGLSTEIQSEIYDFSDKIKGITTAISSQHNLFNSKIDLNESLKNENKKLSKHIKKLEDKEDSSYGMIDNYKKKYFSTIVELVMIILCVLFLMVLLYTEMSKK
jgi:chromosome segregation ATPase